MNRAAPGRLDRDPRRGNGFRRELTRERSVLPLGRPALPVERVLELGGRAEFSGSGGFRVTATVPAA